MRRPTPGEGSYLLYFLPGLLLLLAVIVLPFVMNVVVSFTQWTGVGRPTWVGLDNYTALLGDRVFWLSFRNIAALLLAMVVIPTLLGLLLAAALFDVVADRFGNRVASALRAGYYLPQVLPVAIAGVVWGWILHPSYGALNSILETVGLEGLTQNWLGDPSMALPSVMGVMVWFQIGYPVVMFMAGLQRAEPTLYEAARLDGANWFQRLRYVTLHALKPEMYVVLLTSTVYSLKVFAPVFVLTRGGPGNATIVPSYFAYQNFFERARVGYGAAISTVLTILVLVFAAVFLTAQSRSEAEGAT